MKTSLLQRKLFIISFIILFPPILLNNSCFSQDDKWHETQKYKEGNPFFNFLDNYVCSAHYSFWEDGHKGQGLKYSIKDPNHNPAYMEIGYYDVPEGDFPDLCKAIDNPITVKSVEIKDDHVINIYKKYFRDQQFELKIPFMNAIPAGTGPGAPFVIAGKGIISTLITILNELDADRQVTAIELSAVIAKGGTFKNTVEIIVNKDNHYYLRQNLIYSINIGAEKREYVLYSLIAAIKKVYRCPQKQKLSGPQGFFIVD